ncbi:MAG TPA: MoaD/ThiS family protein [Thermoplasmata archaeon]|nr:MoaD/ThiS family protein [Thermoplasmata archaeon]
MVARVTVLLFATARRAAGTAEVDWPVAPGGVPASALVRSLGERYPKLVPVLRSSRFVLNGEYLDRMSSRVRPGDEFAVHPPYGGG